MSSSLKSVDMPTLIQTGEALHLKGEWEQAIPYLEEIASRITGEGLVMMNSLLADCYINLSLGGNNGLKDDRNYELFTKGVNLATDCAFKGSGHAMCLLGFIAESMEDYPKAELMYRMAIGNGLLLAIEYLVKLQKKTGKESVLDKIE